MTTLVEELPVSASKADAVSSPSGLSARGIAIRLFLTCWMVYVLHFATNTVREIYPALSLGDHLSFDVSEYVGLHPDIFQIPDRGAFINNNPGASILGALPYALARPVINLAVERVSSARARSSEPMREYDTIYPMAREFYRRAYERGLDIKFGLAAGVMQAFLMAPLSALSAVVMFYVLNRLVPSTRSALLLALLYAFATPVFYRTAQLNHNLLVSHCALFAFALAWRPWEDPSYPKQTKHLAVGLFAGWAVLLDYSGAIVVLAVGLYVLVRNRLLPAEVRSKAAIVRFAIGAAIPIALLIGYQWHSFGHPLYPAQHYMPPTAFSGHGYQGMDWPALDLLIELLFGMRYGLFVSAPLLLLALYLPGWFQRSTRIVGGLETWFILLYSVAFLLFMAANQFSRMQFNTGVRHLVPVTPFLFLIAAGVLMRMPAALAILVGILTTYWSWCLTLYRDVEQGLGILESLIHITLEGPRLPWSMTLEGMGYIPDGRVITLLLLGLCGLVIGALWNVSAPTSLAEGPSVN